MPKHFRRRRLQGGFVQVFETDNDADYLRHLIDELAEDFAVQCKILVLQQPQRWLIVNVSGADAQPVAASRHEEKSEFYQFIDELNRVFSSLYTCSQSEFAREVAAWRVRHRPDQRWI